MLAAWILRLNESKKRQNSSTNISSCLLLLFLMYLYMMSIFLFPSDKNEWVGQDMHVYRHKHGVLFSLPFSIYHNVKICI
jgi:amino acid permease